MVGMQMFKSFGKGIEREFCSLCTVNFFSIFFSVSMFPHSWKWQQQHKLHCHLFSVSLLSPAQLWASSSLSFPFKLTPSHCSPCSYSTQGFMATGSFNTWRILLSTASWELYFFPSSNHFPEKKATLQSEQHFLEEHFACPACRAGFRGVN